jgi:hypothetical protein
MKMYAYCFRSGHVEFGNSVPKGAIAVSKGTGKAWQSRIKALCRTSYDGKSHLIPGLLEAKTTEAALDALSRFQEWVRKGKGQTTNDNK